MGSLNYTYIMEYIPKRFNATLEQERERNLVYQFKDGYCPDFLKEKILDRIKLIMNSFPGGSWEICFVPASTHRKTYYRYSSIDRYITEKLGVKCSIDAISKIHDEESGHIAGKKMNPASDFIVEEDKVSGKNIILIDDVITRGNTFCGTAAKLTEKGASMVVGLFIAKTVHPA